MNLPPVMGTMRLAVKAGDTQGNSHLLFSRNLQLTTVVYGFEEVEGATKNIAREVHLNLHIPRQALELCP